MKGTKPLPKRIPKWFYISSGVLILFSCILLLLITYRLEPFVAKKIKAVVNESTLGLYHADFTDIHINLLQGSISFDTLSLRPDTAVIEALRRNNDAPKHLYQLDVIGLALRNISFWDIYYHEKLDLESIVIQKPRITITYNDYKTKEVEDVQKTAYQQISKFLKSIHFNDLILNDADIRYVDRSSSTTQTTDIKGLNVKVTEFRLDSTSYRDKSRFYYTKNIQLNLKEHKFITKDGLYTISIEDLSSSTAGRSLRMENFRVKPNYPEMEFSRKYKEQHDRYDITFKELLLANIDLYKLNTYRRLAASSFVIDGAEVNIFMNRELPAVSFDKGKNYPQLVLKRLKLPTAIDSLFIKNSRISYSEYNPKSKKKGTVTFNKFNAVFKNVTNDSVRLVKDHWLRANVSAWLMNKGRLDVNINMDLSSSNADFNFNGTMGRMDVRELNSLSRNMSLAEIESGIINKAIFNVSGNLQTTTGILKLYYNNLKVNVLKNDEDGNELKKRGLISAIANSLIINNDNPDKKGELRIGKTDAERLSSGSFFNLMWKSIFAGLKESVGFTLGSPDTLQIKPLDKKEQRKLDREKRRSERKEKRESEQRAKNKE
jgi:hypothetical protein